MKWLALLLLAGQAGAAIRSGKVALTEKDAQGGKIFYAENSDKLAPWHLEMTFPRLSGMQASLPSPIRVVLKPGEKKELVRISRKAGASPWGYSTALQANFGDPNAAPDPLSPYLLPYRHGTKRPLGQGYFGKVTHQGLRALDFDMPTGTEVRAARGGVVVNLKQDSNRGGMSRRFAQDANFIEVLHEDGTWAAYSHLKKGGARVKVGQKVKAGDLIGLSGATGMAQGPHLHFCVYKASWSVEPESVATKFLVDEGKLENLEEGKFYYAWQPGLPAFERKSADAIDLGALEAKVGPARGGKLEVREEKLDNAVILWVSNGGPHAQEATLRFQSQRGMAAAPPLPRTRLVPPGKELFFTVARFGPQGGSYSLELSSLERR